MELREGRQLGRTKITTAEVLRQAGVKAQEIEWIFAELGW